MQVRHAAIFVTEAVQLVVQGEAAFFRCVEALQLILSGFCHRESGSGRLCLVGFHAAFAYRRRALGKLRSASCVRLHITAVWMPNIGVGAGHISLPLAVGIASLEGWRRLRGHLHLAESTDLADFVPNGFWKAAVHLHRHASVNHCRGKLLFHWLAVLARSCVEAVSGSWCIIRMSFTVHSVLVRLAKVAIFMARHSIAPDAWLALNLETSHLRVWAAIQAGQASALVREAVAAICHSGQAGGVLPHACRSLALRNIHQTGGLTGRVRQAQSIGDKVI
mmetsp:Transcript_6318/g.14427  ORF Transcript_6318/g.14427 Transcript_6318/m.14427 type:complete len:278 (-) Transcript_6318:1499-2332(-)